MKTEKNIEREIGLELGFLKDRITLGVAAYQSTSKDQTIPITVSWTTGFNQSYVNSGEI